MVRLRTICLMQTNTTTTKCTVLNRGFQIAVNDKPHSAKQSVGTHLIMCFCASSERDHKHTLEQFTAKCEISETRVSTFISEAMICCQKIGVCLFQVAPSKDVHTSKHIVYTSDWKVEHELDWYMGVMSAVIWAFYWTVVVKTDLNQKARCLISIHVLNLIYIQGGAGLVICRTGHLRPNGSV